MVLHQRRNRLISALLCVSMLCPTLTGCHHAPSVAKVAYFGNKNLTHYRDVATEVAYPTETQPVPPQAELSLAPRRIHEISEDTVWDLTLEECIRIALQNGAILKDDGSFGSPGNPLLANPNGVQSAYDIAIQESGFLFGSRGVEAALADFDTQVTTSMTWGRTELTQNAPFLNLTGGDVLTEETGQFSTQWRKQLANSGIFTVQHDMNYSGNSLPAGTRLFQSAFTGFARMEYRQPLAAGAGTEFTRIAGPIGTNLSGVSGVSQGVVISRINSDIAIADFEGSMASMVRDIENRYWDLHLLYQIYDAERVAKGDALMYWKSIKDRIDTTQEQIAQGLTTYYEAVSRVENSLADINENEARLRRLMGLPARDSRIIRPVDSPSEAELLVDWPVVMAEALTRRPEVRSQKWNVKSLELQLKAARNLVRPRFDFVAQYQVNAFGDKLLGDGDAPPGSPGFVNDSAYESLTSNLTSSWNLGFQLAWPLGLRTAHTQARQYELRLAKARAVLAAQEGEIGHELTAAFQQMDRWHRSIVTNKERLEWARRNLQETLTVLREKNQDANTQSRLVQAHINVRESQIAYYRSLIEYNKAITEMRFRKGSILADNNVHLTESLWYPSAYKDALRRAWARTYAWDSKHQTSEPIEITAPAPELPAASMSAVPGPLPESPQPEDTVPDAPTKQPIPLRGQPQTPAPAPPAVLDDFEPPQSVNVQREIRRVQWTQPARREEAAVQTAHRQQTSVAGNPAATPARLRTTAVRARALPLADQLEQLERSARRSGASKPGS